MRNLFLVLHIITGSIALGTMIVPLVSRKGGRAHRRTGWVFVAGMAFATATAIVLSVDRLLTDVTPAGRSFALLLFYLSIVTGSTVSAGVRVLYAKQRTSASRNWWDIGMASALAGSGMLAAIYGLAAREPLFIGFSLVGLLNGSCQLSYWLRPPRVRMHWWYVHMGNMLGGCIAAVSAFVVTNAPRWGLPGDSLLVWLGPTAIGVPAIFIWIGYYRRTFEAGRSGARGGSKTDGRSPRTRPAASGVATALGLAIVLTTGASARAQGRQPFRFDPEGPLGPPSAANDHIEPLIETGARR